MTFRYRLLASGRYEVLRADGFIMGVFGTRDQAETYCDQKNAEAAR
ncbi:hypothetical protein [Sinorhizobium sojae]|nr:hypothetical protein [Sinorhizobium sojae]